MTIGPAPMMSTPFMSVRFGMCLYGSAMRLVLFHQANKTIEQVTNVVGAGAGFWMPLKTERRSVSAAETLQAAVEQRDMGNFHIVRQGCRIDGESVILAGNHHAAAFNILHRMISAMMAELHLHRACAAGEAQELVP